MSQMRLNWDMDAEYCYLWVQIQILQIPSKYLDELSSSPWAAWLLRQTLAADKDPPAHPTTSLSRPRALQRAESTHINSHLRVQTWAVKLPAEMPSQPPHLSQILPLSIQKLVFHFILTSHFSSHFKCIKPYASKPQKVFVLQEIASLGCSWLDLVIILDTWNKITGNKFR